MNAAARLIHLTNRSISATPLCQSLHWPPPLSANPSTGLHSLHPCQSLHWPPLSALHPSLPIPTPLCPPPLSANPSTGLHSVSSTLPIPPLAST
ncbi:unnamed protein product, partial [Staurois parvus]